MPTRDDKQPICAASDVYFSVLDALAAAKLLWRRVVLVNNDELGWRYRLDVPTEVVRWLHDFRRDLTGWRDRVATAQKMVAAEQVALTRGWRPKALRALQAHLESLKSLHQHQLWHDIDDLAAIDEHRDPVEALPRDEPRVKSLCQAIEESRAGFFSTVSALFLLLQSLRKINAGIPLVNEKATSSCSWSLLCERTADVTCWAQHVSIGCPAPGTAEHDVWKSDWRSTRKQYVGIPAPAAYVRDAIGFYVRLHLDRAVLHEISLHPVHEVQEDNVGGAVFSYIRDAATIRTAAWEGPSALPIQFRISRRKSPIKPTDAAGILKSLQNYCGQLARSEDPAPDLASLVGEALSATAAAKAARFERDKRKVLAALEDVIVGVENSIPGREAAALFGLVNVPARALERLGKRIGLPPLAPLLLTEKREPLHEFLHVQFESPYTGTYVVTISDRVRPTVDAEWQENTGGFSAEARVDLLTILRLWHNHIMRMETAGSGMPGPAVIRGGYSRPRTAQDDGPYLKPGQCLDRLPLKDLEDRQKRYQLDKLLDRCSWLRRNGNGHPHADDFGPLVKYLVRRTKSRGKLDVSDVIDALPADPTTEQIEKMKAEIRAENLQTKRSKR